MEIDKASNNIFLLNSIFVFEGGRKFETRIERKENEFMMIDKLKMDQKKS